MHEKIDLNGHGLRETLVFGSSNFVLQKHLDLNGQKLLGGQFIDENDRFKLQKPLDLNGHQILDVLNTLDRSYFYRYVDFRNGNVYVNNLILRRSLDLNGHQILNMLRVLSSRIHFLGDVDLGSRNFYGNLFHIDGSIDTGSENSFIFNGTGYKFTSFKHQIETITFCYAKSSTSYSVVNVKLIFEEPNTGIKTERNVLGWQARLQKITLNPPLQNGLGYSLRLTSPIANRTILVSIALRKIW